ncbi:MAG: hypothetical protein HYS13_25990 [Planctomycetia bacterium]|nr:hypothetical protein [Planctomycetia bacterium]
MRLARVALGLCLAGAALWTAPRPTPAGPGEAAPAPAAVGETPTADEPRQIEAWIEKLGVADYFAREHAQAALKKFGLKAFDALCDAESSASLEIASRARFLLQEMRVDWTAADDPPEIRQFFRGYDELAVDERRAKIERLSLDYDPSALAALCRVARYERSSELSKFAAISIVEQKPWDALEAESRLRLLLSALGPSRRTAVRWLRTYAAGCQADSAGAESAEKLAEAAAQWEQHVAEHAQTAARSDNTLQRELLSGLLREYVRLVTRLKREQETQAAVRRLVESDLGSSESLTALIRFLSEEKLLWPLRPPVQERFASAFEQDYRLWYEMLEAALAMGDEKLADDLASHLPSYGSGDIQLAVALELHRFGLIRSSEREHRNVIAGRPDSDTVVIFARLQLSEILHDRKAEEEAAALLVKAVEGLEANAAIENGRRSPLTDLERIKSIKARRHYYQAMHELGRGDLAAHLRELDLSIDSDPTDADALIALYRLPNPSPERKAKTLQLIRNAVDAYRQDIKLNPNEALPHNQLAWLVGNTEGDYDEAVRMSHRSLEIKPDTSAYLDTLGRCYFALGDYRNAVRYQTLAVHREPTSQQMRCQLDLFRRALRDGKAPQ